MQFRSGFDNLNVRINGKDIKFKNGFYSTDDETEIAVLEKHPLVWSASISEELIVNEARNKKNK